jgi:hypothetical protein
MSISTCVREHLIYGLQLKEYSRDFVGDCLVGPLTGSHYRFLHDLPKLLKLYRWLSERARGTCMMVLRALRDVLSNTIMTDE